jgi:xanthine/CO dehydrogenase XdhC/CoxF family maturation factor
MGAATSRLAQQAESIFRDLGYEVERANGELRATRKWRTVHVTTEPPSEAATTGRLRCFVAEARRAETVRDELLAADHPYDWAVVAVHDDGYDVLHPDAGTLEAP